MIYLFAVIMHFIGDWICQPRDRAKTKSTNTSSLLSHIGLEVNIYLSIVLGVVFTCSEKTDNFTLLVWMVTFLAIVYINMIAHALIDWYLPKIVRNETERQLVNFTAIDQILHLTILFLSIDYML